MMDICEIENKRVKLSSHSITVKNDKDKTCGVVKGITKFHDLRTSEQIKYHTILRSCGIWGYSDYLNCFVVYDGKPYYLHNLRAIKFYEDFCLGNEGFEFEEKKYYQRLNIAEKAKEFMTVIPCYILC